MSRKPPNTALIAEIDAFCKRTGMTVSAFGQRALGDPSFYKNLTDGRDVRLSTMQKLREFMAAPDEAAA